ncbi:MAG: peptidoglycan bridge formation glycyltransferase FemA/FemB family protein [Actinomycetia bacterium]|nr:peptidoglycan bridge formation glycyltransferase FemA/FemB family protein [Actinomycetes bacterium]
MSIQIRPVSPDEHLAFIEQRGSASFLQTPAWAKVKPEWRSQTVGWYSGPDLVGVGLVLFRSLPKIGRSLAYLPEGPVLDWANPAITDYLDTLVEYARRQGAFAVRVGPTPVWRRWQAGTIKAAIADEHVTRLSEVEPDALDPAVTRLRGLLQHTGWRRPRSGSGFAPGQPDFNFWLPLAGATEADLLSGMNQLWRRNIKKAEKEGVEVTLGGRDDLPDFHELYRETAQRDHFTGRPLAYFETMWDALRAEDPDRIRLYLARHQGDLVAATTWVRVGTHAWYSYGASSSAKREVRGSNAIQWRMIRDALAAGATVYDLRGITEGLGADDPELGLIQFKVGTGGEAVQYLGEWDYPINLPLYQGFLAYLNRDEYLATARRGLNRVRTVLPQLRHGGRR